jgi:flagellar motor switch protein FliG
MSQLSPSLRKAAILIAALDEQAAEAILQQMSSDDAAKVRSALVELDNVPPDEQQRVLADFFNAKLGGRQQGNDDGGVDLELSTTQPDLSEPMERMEVPTRPTVARSALPERPSFDFLNEVDSQAIAAVLSRELPQTVAVVVAHLAPEKAAAVLEQLPPTLATDALERIAWLDELSPEVKADLARELRRQLAPHLRVAGTEAGRLPHVNAVLGRWIFASVNAWSCSLVSAIRRC